MNSPHEERMKELSKLIVKEVYLKIMTNAEIQAVHYKACRKEGEAFDSWLASQVKRWETIRDHIVWLHRNSGHYSVVFDILKRELSNGINAI